FFFQAEDGIRDFHVTGVQTCALPIFGAVRVPVAVETGPADGMLQDNDGPVTDRVADVASERQFGAEIPRLIVVGRARRQDGESRSEERRVGKEWRARW